MAVIRTGGDLGAGKTTLCKALAPALGYDYSYTGGIFRAMAAEKGKSIEEFYALMEAHPEVERAIDARQEELMRTKDNLVVEGRIAAFYNGSPFRTVNLFLACDEEVGVRRQMLRPENKGKSFTEMLDLTRERIANERERYQRLYGIPNHLDRSKFDIVIDVTHLTPNEIFQTTMSELGKIGIP